MIQLSSRRDISRCHLPRNFVELGKGFRHLDRISIPYPNVEDQPNYHGVTNVIADRTGQLQERLICAPHLPPGVLILDCLLIHRYQPHCFFVLCGGDDDDGGDGSCHCRDLCDRPFRFVGFSVQRRTLVSSSSDEHGNSHSRCCCRPC